MSQTETLKLYGLLRNLSTDMHMVSSRPCKTCKDLTEKLSWPFGCYEYHEKRKQRLAKERTALNVTEDE